MHGNGNAASTVSISSLQRFALYQSKIELIKSLLVADDVIVNFVVVVVLQSGDVDDKIGIRLNEYERR